MKNLNQHMQEAVTLHQQGQLNQAKALYHQALQHYPQHHGILNLLGTLYAEQENYAQSIAYLQQAIANAPQPESYIFNLAETFCRHQQFIEGIAQFTQLLSTSQAKKAHYPLANAYQHIKYHEKACEHYALALNNTPSHGELYYQYGNSLQAILRLRSARDAYEQGLQHDPHHAAMHYAFAKLCLADNRFGQAEHHFLKTVQLEPEHVNAHFNLWRFYAANDQQHLTPKHCQVIAHQKPASRRAVQWAQRLDFPIIPQSITEKEVAIENLTQALIAPDAFGIDDLQLFTSFDIFPPHIMAYYGSNDRGLREAFAKQIIEANVIPELAPIGASRSRERIGFVVTAGHEGVFIKCMAGIIQQLQSSFETIIVCMQPHGQNILSTVLPQCKYLALPQDLLQAAKSLQAADFDLLYYWEIGTDAYNYFLPFFRTARKQVNSWGWPVTSGIPYVNAFFSSTLLEPDEVEPDEASHHYTEPLILANRLLTYYAPPPVPPQVSREALGIDSAQHIYLCTQNLRKIQPEMDILLTGILNEDPNSHIFFIADKLPALHKRLQARWEQSGLDLERLHILPRMTTEQYLKWVKAADVILDTPCYTGGANTNYDAFEAGTPVITLKGPLHRGRYTSAAYQQMGYTNCVASSPEAYIQKALHLAKSAEFRQETSQQILKRRHLLFEDTQAVHECIRLIKQVLIPD